MVEPEIYTKYRRRANSGRNYMERHPKMDSVKFGKATIRVLDGAGADAGHVDTPRPQLYSNQELVDLRREQECFYRFSYF